MVQFELSITTWHPAQESFSSVLRQTKAWMSTLTLVAAYMNVITSKCHYKVSAFKELKMNQRGTISLTFKASSSERSIPILYLHEAKYNNTSELTGLILKNEVVMTSSRQFHVVLHLLKHNTVLLSILCSLHFSIQLVNFVTSYMKMDHSGFFINIEILVRFVLRVLE